MRVFGIIFFLLVSVSLSAQQRCSHFGKKGVRIFRASNLRSDTLDVLNYRVELDVTDYAGKTLDGRCEVKAVALKSGVTSISLDLLQMTVDSVTQNGNQIAFSYNDTLLVAHYSSAPAMGDTVAVEVFYNGEPQGDPLGWGGWYWSGNYSYNLGVGFGADPHNYGRPWHPCFDNFVERATYDYIIHTNDDKRAYANGYLVSEVVNGGDITRTWRQEETIPTYLACIQIAKYTHVEQNYTSPVTGQNIPMHLIAEPNDTNNFKNSFVNLPLAMESFEEGFGPYFWNKVGFSLVPFNGGAMEHATCISYPRSSANGTLGSETLMAHELAHHWFGNLVTCQTQEDMWMNEGMASFCERIFLEYVYGYEEYINAVKDNHLEVLHHAHIDDEGFRAIHGVPHAFTYGSHSYNKGADVAHTLRSYMGDSAFFGGLTDFLLAYKYDDASAYDMRDFLSANSGVNVDEFFNDWVFNRGFPAFQIDSIVSLESGGSYNVEVFTRQKLRAAPNFYANVPMEVTFMDSDWSTHTVEVVLDGEFTNVTVECPFDPVIWYLNGGDKISGAVTGENLVVNSIGTKDRSYPFFRLMVDNIVDSALVRMEQYWVAPDVIKDGPTAWRYELSTDRFWKISGMDLQNITTKGRVFLNGKDMNTGNLDVEFIQLPGFHEDSVAIMHRVDARDEWKEVPVSTMSTLGSATDGYAYFNIDTLKPGEYTFALKVSAQGIVETIDPKVSVFPNPSGGVVHLNLDGFVPATREIEVVDHFGRKVLNIQMDNLKSDLDLSHLSIGTYVVSIKEDGKILSSQKLQLIR